MANDYIPDLSIRNARIGTGNGRNFSGAKRVVNGQVVNAEGMRNFLLMLDDDDVIESMVQDGWNVKYTKPRDPDEKPAAYISVDATFGKYPPEVWKKTPNGKPVKLEEEDMAGLDDDKFIEAHVVVHPRRYEVQGRTGVKAYLRRLLVTVADDEFSDYFGANDSVNEEDNPF